MNNNFIKVGCGILSATLLSSCFQTEDSIQPQQTQPGHQAVTLRLDPFGMSQLPGAQTRADFTANPNTLLLIDVKDGEVKQTIQLTEGTPAEGSPFKHVDDVLNDCSVILSYGTHDLYILAAAREYASVDPEALTVDWTTEKGNLNYTWAKKVSLEVSQTMDATQPVTLPLVVGKVDLVCLDEQDPAIGQMRILGSGICWTLDLTTMKGRYPESALTISLPYTYQNYNANKSFSFYSFEPEGEWGDETPHVGSVTYAAYRSDNTLITYHAIPNVPVQAGYYTQYQGIFYGNSSNFSLSLTDEWTGYHIESF